MTQALSYDTRELARQAKGEKNCKFCRKTKSLSRFGVITGPTNRVYHRNACKDCQLPRTALRRKEWYDRPEQKYKKWLRHTSKLYKITQQELDKLVKDSEGRCDLCWLVLRGVMDLHIDHDHTSLKVRGILCPKCNMLMSAIDNKVWLKKAIAYKRRSSD